ncbi:MAG TPA: radical SAM protein [Candidatus Paceibacterota bacterium]|nr:radical SAM protein [Candidatus Paceibacterota bacterium]
MHTSVDALNWFLSRTNQIVWRAQRFRASRFLRVLARDGLVALFHQLRPEPVYLSEKVWRDFPERVISGTLPEQMNGLVQEIVVRKLFISDENVDAEELAKARANALLLLNRPTILYLMMAQCCNFACTYCPIPALSKRYGERLLSFEDAVAGIELWRRHIEDQPQDDNPYFLIFYGGEPLLNREVLERLLSHVVDEQNAGQLPQKLELMLCTNGVLVDEQLSRLFARYNVTVAVGVDGPREHNDRIRLTVAGDPTFIEIERAIRQLVSDGVRVVASVTITPANVHQLAEYPSFLRKLGISQFGFNLMKGEALIRELDGKSVEDYCQAAAKGVVRGLADMTDDGRCYEYQLEKKLTTLRNGLPFSVDCTCYGNQLVVQADGQVTNCPFLRFDQGHIRQVPDSFRIGQTETVKAWRGRLPLFNDSILEDGVLDGGGCAWNSSELSRDALAKDNLNTIFTKEVTHELIWILLPKERADALRRGESSHWSYRRIGSL